MNAEFSFTVDGHESRTVSISPQQYSAILAVLAGDQPSLQWDDARERELFENACYAHYLVVRAQRSSRGLIGVLDNAEAPHSRETLFQRNERGEYEAIVYQHAWGGWMLARKLDAPSQAIDYTRVQEAAGRYDVPYNRLGAALRYVLGVA